MLDSIWKLSPFSAGVSVTVGIMWDVLCMMVVSLKLYFHTLMKGFMRRLTNLCELQRICYGTSKGSFTNRDVLGRRMNARVSGRWRENQISESIPVTGYERTIRLETSLTRSKQLARVYATLIKIPEQGRYTEANSAHALEVAVTGIALIKQVSDANAETARL